jgi:lipopolysaccharide export system protein LptA
MKQGFSTPKTASIGRVLALLMAASPLFGLGAWAAPAGTTSAAPTPTPKPTTAPAKSDKPDKPAAKSDNTGLLPTKSKDPIYITADRLDIFDKEGRAVYSGPSGVTATQGNSKLVGTELTAFYDRQKDSSDKPAGDQTQGQGMGASSVKRIVVKGPVSVVQNDQVATGDAGDFDRVNNIVTLTGHVSLTQGQNVTTGDKLVYDLNTGIANVYSAPGVPVKSLFIQENQANNGDQNAQKKAAGKPAPAKPTPAK